MFEFYFCNIGFYFFFLPSRYPWGPGGVIFHKSQGGAQGTLNAKNLKSRKKITFLSPIGIPQGPTIPIKKVYIPVFHAGGHCGLRFSHFIDFLTIFGKSLKTREIGTSRKKSRKFRIHQKNVLSRLIFFSFVC